MKKGFKGFTKRTPPSEEMSLQITSMADIFTIILVFLLKSYATSAVNLTPSSGMMIPKAFAADAPQSEALKLEVSESAVQVEGQPVTALKGFLTIPQDVQNNGALKSLSEAIKIERERQLFIAKANPNVKVDAKIIIVADQRVPYVTLKSVLASAAINGYTDYKLAVIKAE